MPASRCRACPGNPPDGCENRPTAVPGCRHGLPPQDAATWTTAVQGVVHGPLGRILVTGLVVVTVATAPAQTLRRRAAPIRRAPPPSATWSPLVANAFFDDAFATLEGPRPDFTRGAPQTGGMAAATTPDASPQGDGFRWSTLVSEDTLTDEIKELKDVAAEACATPSAFKGGGYSAARSAFSSIAVAFGVIAAYDGDVRWQKDAATARDLFARAGFNCKVGTDQSFAEAKARLEDLDRMLQGSAPEGRPEREEEFLWSQVAGRPPLMMRLEDALAALRPATASAGEFKQQADVAIHAAEVIAVIGEVIQRRDFEYHDDETYVGYSKEMRDAAVELRRACREGDYDAARAAASRIEKSCSTCHGDYRG
jgi:hypothetical protein